jgi:hypothetical protein
MIGCKLRQKNASHWPKLRHHRRSQTDGQHGINPHILGNASLLTLMPVRRTKACVNCRMAKARCSLSAPCSRCAKRHLGCQYAHTQGQLRESCRAEGFRSIRPAVDRSLDADGADSIIAAAPATTSSSVQLSDQGFKKSSWTAATGNVQALELGGVPHEHASNYSGSILTITQAPHNSHTLSHVLASPYLVDALSPSWFLNIDFDSSIDSSCESYALNGSRLLATPNSTDLASTNGLAPQLSQRSRSIQQGSLTAKMIFSRLVEYTRMMADQKNLPPFIHPPCCQGQGDECPSNSPHQCLPELLAICSTLTQMFHSRVSGSHSFVWQQICTHLRQLKAEVSSSASA